MDNEGLGVVPQVHDWLPAPDGDERFPSRHDRSI